MKILSHLLYIVILLSTQTPTGCMELENIPKIYKDIHTLITSEHYRSAQFSDKTIIFEEKKLATSKNSSFTFEAHKSYSITSHTINTAKVKKTINTELNDQCNKIRLETSHISFGSDHKYNIENISTTDLPSQQIIPEPSTSLSIETLPVKNTQELPVIIALNSNAENTDHENGTIARKETSNITISNDCLCFLIVVLSKPLKKMLNPSSRYLAHLLPTVLRVWYPKKLK